MDQKKFDEATIKSVFEDMLTEMKAFGLDIKSIDWQTKFMKRLNEQTNKLN